jgi:nitrogen fixation-related uncharacterized protein
MAIGLGISLVVFVWALNNGQFKEQQRARYLPLHEAPEPPAAKPGRFVRLQVFVLFAMAALGLAASGAIIVFALIHGK